LVRKINDTWFKHEEASKHMSGLGYTSFDSLMMKA
jgi:hypothetical protein